MHSTEGSQTVNGQSLPEIHLVPFHGDTIATLEHDGTRYVAMRRVVENLGMAWGAQRIKLVAQKQKFGCVDIDTPSAGGVQETVCVPVEKLALWLAGINPIKVRADLRDKVERYQAESAIALHDYWTKGYASRVDTFDGVVTGLSAEVRSAIGGIVKGIMHREIAVLLPAAIDSALLSDPRRAALDYVSVRQLLDEAKAVQKGRNGLNRRCGYDLRRRVLKIVSTGEPSPVRHCPASGVILFKREMAEQFMRERGHGLVAAHNAKQIGGQTVIAFPDRSRSNAERPEPAAI